MKQWGETFGLNGTPAAPLGNTQAVTQEGAGS